MSTVIYPSPIFGPVRSRRLGVSLGINLLPEDGKWCSFDCIYCECGFNKERKPRKPLPTREEVRQALEIRLQDMQQNGPKPDVLTLAGNGEPTLHPLFPEIVDDILSLRNQYFPQAKVSLLSNSTQLHRKQVREAVVRLDNPIMKLDTVSPLYINKVDKPAGHYDVDQLVEVLAEMNHNIIIQTMFMTGEYEGESVDNCGEEYVEPWLKALQHINPRQVMIYTIDRETPAAGLQKASHEQLDAIARRVEALGIPVSVSY